MKTISFNNQKTLVEKFNVSNNSIDYTFELTMNFTIVDTDLEKKGVCDYFELTRDNGAEKVTICRGRNVLTSDKLVAIMSKLGYELNIEFSKL